MLPEQEVRFSPTVHWSQRRPFGLGPATLLAGLAGATFVFAIVLFATGSWVAGIVFLVVSAIEICLFLVAVRREPEAYSARLAMTAADRADGLGRLAAITISAGSRTALELARIWRLRRRLRVQFKRHLTPLGEAVYHDDPARAARLKEQARQLEQALRDADRRASEAKAALRVHIEREHATSQSTQRLPLGKEKPASEKR